MTSSGSSVNALLADYAAGKVSAELLISAVAAQYYGETHNGKREAWRPIMDVVERAHPGVVELKSTAERPGFTVALAERPFPKAFEADLQRAVEHVLATFPASPSPFPAASQRKPGWIARIAEALRRVFRRS